MECKIYTMYYLYIVNCVDDVVYVGVTRRPDRRRREHFKGRASCVTCKYMPLAFTIIDEFKDKEVAYREETSTVKLLRRNGIKAYGGGYTTPN